MLDKRIIAILLIVAVAAVTNVSAADNRTDILTDDGSFSDLNDVVQSNLTEIALDKNYVYTPQDEDDCIYIWDEKTIDGNGHTIDANKHSRIFYSSQDNVILRNIVITNINQEEYSSPIYLEGNGCIIENCTFISNNAQCPLIELSGMNAIVRDCKFENNNVYNLIYLGSGKYTFSSLEVTNNTANEMIYGTDSSNTKITDSSFISNSARLIVLHKNTVISDCRFENNSHKFECDSFIQVSAGSKISNCSFDNFIFKKEEYAIVETFGANSIISSCNFTNNGNARCTVRFIDESKNTISGCRFENNTWDSFAETCSLTVLKNNYFANNTANNSIGIAFSGAILNHKYVLDVYFSDSNGMALKKQKVTYKIGTKSYTKTTDSEGHITVVYTTFGTKTIHFTNPATGEKADRKVTLHKVFDNNKNVVKYYKSPVAYKVRVFNLNGKIAKGVKVRFTIGTSTCYVKTDNKGYATLKLNQKPGTYSVSAKYNIYFISNKITVKPTVITKDISKKYASYGRFNVKILNANGKAFANQVVKVKFNGKVNTLKTNRYGIASLIIPKNLKIGKYTITTGYNGYGVTNKISVVR